MEIITGVERRERWRIEDKLRIVAEAETPGAIISHVARRHHISRGLLSNWRQQVRRGALAADDHSAVFMPVRMLSEPMSSSPAVAVPREQNGVAGVVAEDRRIEIALPDGTCIRVGADVGVAPGHLGRAPVIAVPSAVRVWHPPRSPTMLPPSGPRCWPSRRPGAPPSSVHRAPRR